MAKTVANTSVDQVFDVLAVVGAGPDPLGVAEVARRVGLPTSTAHRVLVTLLDADYLMRDATGTKYQLGIMADELADSFFARYPIRAAAAPTLRRLVALSGETVTLSVRLGFYAVAIAGLEGWREIHATTGLGLVRPLGDGPAGCMLLAGLDDVSFERFRRWRPESGAALEDRGTLEAELSSMRRRGIAVIPGSGGGTTQVVFAVRDPAGRPAAVLTIEGGATSFRPRQRDPEFKRWRSMVAELESALAERPRLFADPYQHVPPEEIQLDPSAGDAALVAAAPRQASGG